MPTLISLWNFMVLRSRLALLLAPLSCWMTLGASAGALVAGAESAEPLLRARGAVIAKSAVIAQSVAPPKPEPQESLFPSVEVPSEPPQLTPPLPESSPSPSLPLESEELAPEELAPEVLPVPSPVTPQPSQSPEPSPKQGPIQSPEAEALTQQVEAQYSQGEFAAAKQTLEQLLALQRQPEQRAETFNLIGLVNDRLDQFDASASAYQQALDAYRQLKTSQPQVAQRGEARTLNNLGALYASAERVNEALGFLERSLSLFRVLNNRESEAVTLRNLGSLYLRAERGEDAINALENSLQIESELERPVEMVGLLDRLSSLYLSAGSPNEALVALQKAFRIVEPSNDLSSKLALLTRMAQLYEGTRRPDKAVETYQAALALVKKTPKEELGEVQPRLEGRLRDRIARVFADTGETQRALAQYEKVLAIAKDLEDPLGQAQILTTMGDLQRRREALDEAQASYTDALALVKPLERPIAEGRLLSGLAVIARDSERWDEALDLAKQALAIQERPLEAEAEQSLQTAGKAITLNLLGDIYRYQKQYEPAAAAYQQSLRALGQDNLLLRGANLTNLGEMLLALGQAQEAVRPLGQAIELWEAVGLEAAEGQGRNPVSLSYQRLSDALVAQGEDAAALAVVEQGRSRLYRTFLDLRQPTQAPPVKPLSPQQIRQLAQDQQATVLVYDFADGFAENPEASVVKNADAPTFQPQSLRIWQLSPQGQLQRQTLNLSPEQQQLLQSLAPQQGEGASEQQLNALGDLLLQPLQDSQPSTPNRQDAAPVIVVPPVELQRLPWAALPLQNQQNQTLLDQHTLTLVPSLQLLAKTPASPLDGQRDNQPAGRETSDSSSAPLIVGAPATPNGRASAAVKQQVEAIAQTLGVEAFTDQAATLRAIAPRFTRAQLIHLALPQLNVEGVGEALAFASSSELQGMTPADILALQLQAELVVLHGLTGNLDKPSPTEWTLAQAFRATGVPAVLSSTGQASDAATRDLMTDFYGRLKTGGDRNPAQSLRQSMLQLRQQYPKAADWASFVLVGGNDPFQLQARPAPPAIAPTAPTESDSPEPEQPEPEQPEPELLNPELPNPEQPNSDQPNPDQP